MRAAARRGCTAAGLWQRMSEPEAGQVSRAVRIPASLDNVFEIMTTEEPAQHGEMPADARRLGRPGRHGAADRRYVQPLQLVMEPGTDRPPRLRWQLGDDAAMDRNASPMRYAVTTDGLLVAGSAGMVRLKRRRHQAKGRRPLARCRARSPREGCRKIVAIDAVGGGRRLRRLGQEDITVIDDPIKRTRGEPGYFRQGPAAPPSGRCRPSFRWQIWELGTPADGGGRGGGRGPLMGRHALGCKRPISIGPHHFFRQSSAPAVTTHRSIPLRGTVRGDAPEDAPFAQPRQTSWTQDVNACCCQRCCQLDSLVLNSFMSSGAYMESASAAGD